MSQVRQQLETLYYESNDLGILNALLAFEDTELLELQHIMNRLRIQEHKNKIMTIEEKEDITPIEDITPSESFEEEIVVHKRFQILREVSPSPVKQEAETSKDKGKETVEPIPPSYFTEDDTTEVKVLNTKDLLSSSFTPKKGQSTTILDIDCTLELEK